MEGDAVGAAHRIRVILDKEWTTAGRVGLLPRVSPDTLDNPSNRQNEDLKSTQNGLGTRSPRHRRTKRPSYVVGGNPHRDDGV